MPVNIIEILSFKSHLKNKSDHSEDTGIPELARVSQRQELFQRTVTNEDFLLLQYTFILTYFINAKV